MEWNFVVALVVAVPVILFPAAVVWYLNLAGIGAKLKQTKPKRIAARKPPR